jgi:hypothetical protein
MPLLKKRFPQLRLQMREDLTARLVDALRARTLDAAVIALPYTAHGIATSVVAEDEFFLVCPETHPLAHRNDLAPEHLKSEDVLLLEDGHCLREHALSACQLAPGRRSSEVGATSLHTLVQMVSGGMGVTLLPKIAADGGAAAGAHVAVRRSRSLWSGVRLAWRGAKAVSAKKKRACWPMCCARNCLAARLRSSANPAWKAAWPDAAGGSPAKVRPRYCRASKMGAAQSAATTHERSVRNTIVAKKTKPISKIDERRRRPKAVSSAPRIDRGIVPCRSGLARAAHKTRPEQGEPKIPTAARKTFIATS